MREGRDGGEEASDYPCCFYATDSFVSG